MKNHITPDYDKFNDLLSYQGCGPEVLRKMAAAMENDEAREVKTFGDTLRDDLAVLFTNALQKVAK